MAKYPMHPRLAHMMLKAKALDLSYEASLLATLLTEKDIYHKSHNNADLAERVSVLHDIATQKSMHTQHVNTKQCHYLLANAKRIEPRRKETLNKELLGVLLAFAYPERIAKQRNAKGNSYLLSNGKGAIMHHDELLCNERFLVIADLDAKSTHASIYKAIALSQAQIEAYLDRTHTKNTKC